MNLLLAAFPPELAGLDAAPPSGWRVATAGVGAVEAAVTTTRLLHEVRPARVLFVGTCGAYDDRLAVGDCVAASEAIATSVEEAGGEAYRPVVERTRWPAAPLVAPGPLPLPAVAIACVPAITRSPRGASLLARVAPAEHLELSGVLAACVAAGVPCSAALVVANRVGPGAHEEWRANHARVSRALVARLRELGVI